MTIILRFPGNVSWTSCRVLTWSTFPWGSCLTFWPRTCGLPRVWSTSTSSTRSAGSRRWSSSAGTRTSSSGRWGPGRGMVQTPHITLLQARHPSIQGTTMKTILQNLPLPEGDKLQLSNSLNELKTPLLQDKTVFILTFLLGKIFHKIFFQTKAEPRAELSSRFIRLWKQCQCLYAYVNQSVQMLFLYKSKKYYMLRPLFKYYKDILFQLFWTWRTIARCGGWGTG